MPTQIHQRVPFVFGARDEVDLIEAYHAEVYDEAEDELDIPLYAIRGLFRGSR